MKEITQTNQLSTKERIELKKKKKFIFDVWLSFDTWILKKAEVETKLAIMKVSIIPALCNEHQSHQNFVGKHEIQFNSTWRHFSHGIQILENVPRQIFLQVSKMLYWLRKPN